MQKRRRRATLLFVNGQHPLGKAQVAADDTRGETASSVAEGREGVARVKGERWGDTWYLIIGDGQLVECSGVMIRGLPARVLVVWVCGLYCSS